MTLQAFSDLIKKYGEDNGVSVAHFQSQENSFPILVYSEQMIDYLMASGKPVSRKIDVSIALYTKDEFAPEFTALEKVLLDNHIVPAFTVTWSNEDRFIQHQGQFSLLERLS